MSDLSRFKDPLIYYTNEEVWDQPLSLKTKLDMFHLIWPKSINEGNVMWIKTVA